METLRYLRKRLGEKSTWGGFISAIAGVANPTGPTGWLLIGLGVVMVLMPEPEK